MAYINKDQAKWNDIMYGRIRDNDKELIKPGDPVWLAGQLPFHLQNYKATEDGRMLQRIFYGAMAAPVAGFALVETGLGTYLVPRFGFSPGGAIGDIVMQKMQGKSWYEYNWATTLSNGFLGGGSVFANALAG